MPINYWKSESENRTFQDIVLLWEFYVELPDQWNGPVFSSKKSYLQAPVIETLHIFPLALYLHKYDASS